MVDPENSPLSFTDMIRRSPPGTTLVCPIPYEDGEDYELKSRQWLQRLSSFAFRSADQGLKISSFVCKLLYEEKDEAAGRFRDVLRRGIYVTVLENALLNEPTPEPLPEGTPIMGRPPIPRDVLAKVRELNTKYSLDWSKFDPEKLIEGPKMQVRTGKRGRPAGSRNKPKTHENE